MLFNTLIHVNFIDSKIKTDDALLDHDQLSELFAIPNNFISWQIQLRVDVAQEVACKFATALKFGIVEEIEEIGQKVTKQAIYQLMSDLRFQLQKEL